MTMWLRSRALRSRQGRARQDGGARAGLREPPSTGASAHRFSSRPANARGLSDASSKLSASVGLISLPSQNPARAAASAQQGSDAQ